MEETAKNIYDTFWAKSFWLPPNVTWEDLEDDTIYIAKPRDLWAAFPIAVGLFIVRLIFERLVALPIGKRLHIKEAPPRPPVPNDVLEKAFKQHKKVIPNHEKLEDLSKKCDLSTRQIERWWRRRRVMHKPSEMTRWKETSWRFIYYLTAFWYGMYILYQKPWFWDTRHCWYGYPKQETTSEIYWYYMIELGFYWSLVLSLFMDVKRKDFGEMIVHHIATILLLTLSWADNMIRIGTLVLVVHDAVDYWMEGAKLAKYARYNKLCDCLFVVFTVVWFITRLVIYPLRVIYSTSVEAPDIIDLFGGPSGIKGQYIYFAFNGLLITLQLLHLFWTYYLLIAIKAVLTTGNVEKDERSETEPETCSEDEHIIDDYSKKKNSNNNLMNGTGDSPQRLKNRNMSKIPRPASVTS